MGGCIEDLPQPAPTSVLMDITLPGMTGSNAFRQLKALIPGNPGLRLTVLRRHGNIFNALTAEPTLHAKRTLQQGMLEAIQEVHRGVRR